MDHPTEQTTARSQAHSDAIEQALCACVLADARVFYAASERVKPHHFYREPHRDFWDALPDFLRTLELDTAHATPVDPLLLRQHLRKLQHWHGQIDAILLPLERAKRGALPVSADRYAREVRRYADLRALAAAGQSMSAKSYDETADPEDLIREAVSELLSAVDEGSATRRQLGDVALDWIDGLDDWISGTADAATSTGIPGLDYLLGGGICTGRSYYLGGLTKMGKTTLALAIARELALRGGWAVDFISVEMSHEDLMRAIVQAECGVNLARWRALAEQDAESIIKTPSTQSARVRIMEAVDSIQRADFNIDVQGAPSVHDLELAVRARRARLPAGTKYMIVCDYIQNFSTGRARQDDASRISEISRTINGWSKSLSETAVMPLFQFDKEAEKVWLRERKAPHFSNARGSSQIGNDANHLLIWHRNYRDFEQEDKQCGRYGQVIQDLSRHGRIGYAADLDANMAVGRFRDWTGDVPAPRGSGGEGAR